MERTARLFPRALLFFALRPFAPLGFFALVRLADFRPRAFAANARRDFALFFAPALGALRFALRLAAPARLRALPRDDFLPEDRRPPLVAALAGWLAARPATAPMTPPTTAPTGPATLPRTAPVAAPAACFEIGGIKILSEDSALEED